MHTHLKLEKFPKSPFAKGDFPNLDPVDKSSPKQTSKCRIRMGKKKSMRSSYECIRTFIRIIRCKLILAPISISHIFGILIFNHASIWISKAYFPFPLLFYLP